MPIDRVTDLAPAILNDFALNMGKRDRDWIRVRVFNDNEFQCVPSPGCERAFQGMIDMGMVSNGCEMMAILALSRWLVDGPKVFRPTLDQCRSMEHIECNVRIADYSQPYEAILVQLPVEYAPFKGVLCFMHPSATVFAMYSIDFTEDLTQMAFPDATHTLESLINSFDQSVEPSVHATAVAALRVAINSCLALSSFGHQCSVLFPKEVANDHKLAAEQSPRGERARGRLPLAMQLVSFSQEVVLRRRSTARAESNSGEGSGREQGPHWRRGHWTEQPHGPGNSLRKRILRPAVLVREDLFIGELLGTSTMYRARS